MADYRLVYCKMWSEDDWFATLEAQRRLLWIYLFTNDDASLSGLYVIRDEKIALETGLDLAFIRETLAWFQTEGKIERAGWVIWVKNMRKYQNTRSSTVQKCIVKDVNAISDCPIKRHYLAVYSMHPVSIEYAYGSDVSDSDSDSDSDTNTDTERGASAPPASLLSEPLCSAYLDSFRPGETIPVKQRPKAYASILRLRQHPHYDRYLPDKNACLRLWTKYKTDHPNMNGDPKPLQYFEQWIWERLTQRAKDANLLPPDWKEEPK